MHPKLVIGTYFLRLVLAGDGSKGFGGGGQGLRFSWPFMRNFSYEFRHDISMNRIYSRVLSTCMERLTAPTNPSSEALVNFHVCVCVCIFGLQ